MYREAYFRLLRFHVQCNHEGREYCAANDDFAIFTASTVDMIVIKRHYARFFKAKVLGKDASHGNSALHAWIDYVVSHYSHVSIAKGQFMLVMKESSEKAVRDLGTGRWVLNWSYVHGDAWKRRSKLRKRLMLNTERHKGAVCRFFGFLNDVEYELTECLAKDLMFIVLDYLALRNIAHTHGFGDIVDFEFFSEHCQ